MLVLAVGKDIADAAVKRASGGGERGEEWFSFCEV